MQSSRVRTFLFSLGLAVTATLHAQTISQTSESQPVAGGTLTWIATYSQQGACPVGNPQAQASPIYTWTTGQYVFTIGGASTSLGGATAYVVSPGGQYCPPSGSSSASPQEIGVADNFTFYAQAVNGPDDPITTVSNGTPFFINPKYVVVGVIYAPPGSSSYVQYTNLTSVGNTVNLSDSFTNDVGFSVTTSGKLGAAAASTGGNVTLTSTASTDYTYGSSSSVTQTLSQATTVSYKIGGTPSESPVNSDYDYILLWVNPELLMNYQPPAGSNPASLTWNGYAFDPNDPVSGQPPASGPYISGPDIAQVQVGCLNGHFSCPSTLTWLNNVQDTGSYVSAGLLARTWASAGNGYQYPSGEVSGLTFNDVCQVLLFDPFSVTPADCPTQNNYTLLSSYPSTSADGRFTKEAYPPNPIQYAVGGANESYSLAQTNSLSVASGNSYEFKQAFSVEEQFGGSILGLFQGSTTLKQSLTLDWKYSTLSTLANSTTLTNALSVTGPPNMPAYSGPVQFIGYQDNTFGTFAFVPAP